MSQETDAITICISSLLRRLNSELDVLQTCPSVL